MDYILYRSRKESGKVLFTSRCKTSNITVNYVCNSVTNQTLKTQCVRAVMRRALIYNISFCFLKHSLNNSTHWDEQYAQYVVLLLCPDCLHFNENGDIMLPLQSPTVSGVDVQNESGHEGLRQPARKSWCQTQSGRVMY